MITIVTVCYNAENDIEQTLKSILKQESSDIEYIIKDGGSVDDTMKIINKYKSKLENKLKRFVLISESDSGLYNAMNIATKYVTGEYIIFLNAGDYFYSPEIIKIFLENEFEEDIIYGDTIHKENNLTKRVDASEYTDDIKYRMLFCHQSAFIKTTIMKEYGYNENYKISSDYEFFLKCYKNGKTFKYIHTPISIFILGGISYIQRFELTDETYSIQLEQGMIDNKRYLFLKNKNDRKKRIRNLIPLRAYKILRKVKNLNKYKES